MGKRGPAPEPTKLKVLHGNRGKRPLNDREPEPAPGASMPAWLSQSAKSEWKRITPELSRLGLVTTVDRAALAAYCQAYAELLEATKTLDAEGRIVPVYATHAGDTVLDPKGKPVVAGRRLHPAVKLQRDAFARVKSFLAEFGLTPSSRTRLSAAPAAADNPFAEFLNRARSKRQA
jgi:P27 family predicted phage terminase small subunit